MKRILLFLFVLSLTLFVHAQTSFSVDDLYIQPGETKDVTVHMVSTEDVAGIEMKITLPKGITYAKNSKGMYILERVNWNSDHTISSNKLDNDTLYIMAVSLSCDYIEAGTDAILKIKVTASNDIAVGEYNSSINKIVVALTVREGEDPTTRKQTIDRIDWKCNVYTPLTITNENGVLSIAGGELNAAEYASIIESQSSFSVVDLRSAVLASDLTISEIKKAGASLYYLPSGSNMQGDNIVIDNKCSNYIIQDGTNLVIPTPFTATNATYSRTMANQWGTIVLPYDVASDENVEYYIPSGVGSSTLKLTKWDNLPANTPALVAKVNDGATGINANASNVEVSSALSSNTYENVTMYGSYINNEKVETQNAYYIKSNKFWLNNQYFFIDAFRAYFTITGAPQAKSLNISRDDATVIDALMGDGDIRISEYYDISGKRIDKLQKGINIVRLTNGMTKKVIVE